MCCVQSFHVETRVRVGRFLFCFILFFKLLFRGVSQYTMHVKIITINTISVHSQLEHDSVNHLTILIATIAKCMVLFVRHCTVSVANQTFLVSLWWVNN